MNEMSVGGGGGGRFNQRGGGAVPLKIHDQEDLSVELSSSSRIPFFPGYTDLTLALNSHENRLLQETRRQNTSHSDPCDLDARAGASRLDVTSDIMVPHLGPDAAGNTIFASGLNLFDEKVHAPQQGSSSGLQ